MVEERKGEKGRKRLRQDELGERWWKCQKEEGLWGVRASFSERMGSRTNPTHKEKPR